MALRRLAGLVGALVVAFASGCSSDSANDPGSAGADAGGANDGGANGGPGDAGVGTTSGGPGSNDASTCGSVCAGACVDLATDDAHCGTCGTTCGAGTGCFGGHCTKPAAPTDPTPRGASAAATGPDGKIYVIGGVSQALSTCNLASVMAFDPATNTWSAPPPLLAPRCFLAATTDKSGLIYALGGTDGNNQWTATSQTFDLTSPNWVTKASFPALYASPSATTGSDGKLYVLARPIGGAGNADLLAYSPAAGTWATLTGPGKQTCPLVGGADGRLYAIGSNNTVANVTTSLEIYDTAAGTWSDGASFEQSRAINLGVALADGRIFIAGGTVTVASPPSFTQVATSQIYDPKANAWSAAADAPAAFSLGAASTGHDGRVYVAIPLLAATVLFVFNPTTNRWASSN